jgi:hypothetical protein
VARWVEKDGRGSVYMCKSCGCLTVCMRCVLQAKKSAHDGKTGILVGLKSPGSHVTVVVLFDLHPDKYVTPSSRVRALFRVNLRPRDASFGGRGRY